MAAVLWLGLTAVSVLIGDTHGFLPQMGKALAGTAAGVAFAVSGAGAAVQIWQRHRMRQKTGPIVLEEIVHAAEACGAIAGCYLFAARVNPCNLTDTSFDAAYLMKPPLLRDQSDLKVLHAWADMATARALESARDIPPTVRGAPAASPLETDLKFLNPLSDSAATLAAAAKELERSVVALTQLGAGPPQIVLAGTYQVNRVVAEQLEALRSQPSRLTATLSWGCSASLVAQVAWVAHGLDSCWASTLRIGGRRHNALVSAGRSYQGDEVRRHKEFLVANFTNPARYGNRESAESPK